MLSRRVRRVWVLGATLALIAAGAKPERAAASTATGTIAVSATVINICTVATGSVLAFGNYSGSQKDGTATIVVTCTSGTSETIGLDAGANAANASGTTRAMAFSSNYLNYEIYQDSGRSTVWGNSGAATASSTGTGLPQNITAYARIPGSQLGVPAGAYVDTVNITVTY